MLLVHSPDCKFYSLIFRSDEEVEKSVEIIEVSEKDTDFGVKVSETPDHQKDNESDLQDEK